MFRDFAEEKRHDDWKTGNNGQDQYEDEIENEDDHEIETEDEEE